MALTDEQKTTLKADILAHTDPVVVQALSDGANGVIADWYNLDAVADFWIFRRNVTAKEVSDAINLKNMVDITAADSDRVVKIFQLRSFDGGEFHGDVASDRTAFDDAFSAAAGDESQQAIAALWQRLATNAEKLYSLSTDTGATSATADTTAFQGSLSHVDIQQALAS